MKLLNVEPALESWDEDFSKDGLNFINTNW